MKNIFFILAILAGIFIYSCNDEPVTPENNGSENKVTDTVFVKDTIFISDTVLVNDTTIITDTLIITETVFETDTVFKIDTIVIVDTVVSLIYNIDGLVQKGPFINGTSISIHELNADLTQTGKSFSTQIVDNRGTFELRNIKFESPYVELKADGFYFNEVNNETSNGQLTLYAIADIKNRVTLNVNVLSYLEKSRIQKLISNGETFQNAKKQAQAEVLAVFNIDNQNMPNSEELDISQADDQNAILLAVSAILQGHLSTGELAELLANFSTDIRDDGILNSNTTKSQLINAAKILDQAEVRSNIEAKYESMGLNVTVANFEDVVNYFIENSDFEVTDKIEYPENGKYGKNVLCAENRSFPAGIYSMKAILPDGYTLKVELTGDGLGYYIGQNDPGWVLDSSDPNSQISTYLSTRTGEIDLKMGSGLNDFSRSVTVKIYENGASSPTFTKVISADGNGGFTIPETGLFGTNVFSLSDSTLLDKNLTYSLAVNLPDDHDYNLEIKMHFSHDNSYAIDSAQIQNWQVYESSGELRLVLIGRNISADMPIQFIQSGYLSIEGALRIEGLNW